MTFRTQSSMLKATIYNVVLLCTVIQPVVVQNEIDENDMPSRPDIMQMIDGDMAEKRLYLERCSQSSLHETCSFALDEDINQEPWSNECAITTADEEPFWDARLENPAYITRVQIFSIKNIDNRGYDALTEFQLKVGHHICVSYKSETSFTNKTFACDCFGDNVRIQSSKKQSVLALCEVVVYGKYVELHRGFANPLTHKSCSIKECDLALDGNLEQGDIKKCAVSDNTASPSLMVRLSVPSLVRGIVIYALEGHEDKVSNIEVFVNDQLCVRYDSEITFKKKEFPCGRFGTRVRVTSTKPVDHQLMICELQLFGYPTQFRPLGHNVYVGCFREKRNNRDLQKMVAVDHMSVEKCERICRRQKKPYFGLQQGKQCWCSERYGMYGELPKRECWMNCDGDPNQECGAKLVNGVFKIV